VAALATLAVVFVIVPRRFSTAAGAVADAPGAGAGDTVSAGEAGSGQRN
jgi:hypothetical protein